MTQALKHCEEFLDKSRDFEDLSAQERHALLRRARAVVMECLHTIKPPEIKVAESSSSPIEYDDNLKLNRAAIFDTTTENQGWSNGMLSAISTAMKMGATNFEISIKPEKAEGNQSARYGLGLIDMLAMQSQTEAWSRSTFMVWRVIIYAVTVR